MAECELTCGVLESAVYQDYEPSLHRRKPSPLPAEPTVAVMKADSHLQVDPSTVCVSSGARVNWRSLQTDRARILCDQQEYANTERDADGYRTSGWLSTP